MSAEIGLRRRIKGLSEAEFRQRFGTKAKARQSSSKPPSWAIWPKKA